MADGNVNKRAKDVAMAAYMKKHKGQFPDSVMRPHNGCGADMRKMALSMGKGYTINSTFTDRGILGGILAHRAGLASATGIGAYIG